jgi:RNA polymerase sigma-70 factor (sigma-E family)
MTEHIEGEAGSAVADADGFAEFVTARSTRLLRTAYLLTSDWARAEDLLQTSLAKAWFVWKRIDTNPEPYVRKIIVNTYASWWHRRWNGERPTEELPERAGHDEQAGIDERDALWRALRRLPKRQRAVVVLRYFEDLSEAEVAEALGTSVGTVKSQAAKALAKLRIDATLRSESQFTPAPEGV